MLARGAKYGARDSTACCAWMEETGLGGKECRVGLERKSQSRGIRSTLASRERLQSSQASLRLVAPRSSLADAGAGACDRQRLASSSRRSRADRGAAAKLPHPVLQALGFDAGALPFCGAAELMQCLAFRTKLERPLVQLLGLVDQAA